MSGKHLLSVADCGPAVIAGLLESAARLKRQPRQGLLEGATIALVFEKPSLRTRLSFDVGINQLGGHAVYLNQQQIGVGSREAVEDVARVLGRMVDGVVARVGSHRMLERLAAYAGVPVINALSDLEHPCQALADLFTIQERFPALRGHHLAYIGDGNNVANSLVLACASVGIDFTIACPDGYEIPPSIWQRAESLAATSGSRLRRVCEPGDAVGDADILYTDVWTSMGQEGERLEREQAFARYQINQALVAAARPGAIVMHDLPAHRGEEITAETLETFADVIFTQAENRLHMQKAILATLLGGGVL